MVGRGFLMRPTTAVVGDDKPVFGEAEGCLPDQQFPVLIS